ncbi:MAG TPA: hypothetical protein VFH27_03755 [Longimicrobiaceae bacterium]|nr:hypothetical protein [Longimicrobiaceae bacterium]
MTGTADRPRRDLALTILRVVSVLVAAWLARAVLRDPYTLHLHGGEVMLPAPWWHGALAAADLVLLAAFAASAWRWSARTTFALLLGESLVHVAATLFYVWVDGMSRFVFGFAQQSFLAPWLALVALRFALALLWTVPVGRHDTQMPGPV